MSLIFIAILSKDLPVKSQIKAVPDHTYIQIKLIHQYWASKQICKDTEKSWI